MKRIWRFICVVFIGISLLFTTACNTISNFKINFIVDSEIYSTVQTTGNEVITMPKDPVKTNYTFEGWYRDKDIWENEFTARSLLETPLSSNMEVYAHFIDGASLIGTDINVKSAEKVYVEGIGDLFYLVLRNDQLVCKLNDYIECNPKTSWALSKDLSGNNQIQSKTVSLVLGDNPLYYIYVTDKNQKHETYILLIHRNYMYTVTFNSNGGSSCGSQEVEEGYKLQNVPTSSKEGYVFDGWDYNFDTPIKGNVIANAKRKANQYTITYDVNGGNPLDSNVQSVVYGDSYDLKQPNRQGYVFEGWYNGDTIFNSGTWYFTEDVLLVARWTIAIYDIYYNLNGGVNNPSNPYLYTIEDSFKFEPATREGYSFIGWYNGENLKTGIERGSTGTLNLEAKWEANLNNLLVISDNSAKGTVSIISGSGYSGECITVMATPVGDCVFKGWYHESTKVSDDATYTFVMPTNDYSLVAHFFTKEEEKLHHFGIIPSLSDDGKTITYGLYPQKNVNNSSLVSALNALTTPESNGWYFYDGDFYAKVSASLTGSRCKFDNGTTISNGTTYWFECEPIVWNVLSNNSGEYYIVSSFLLDAHRYNESYSGTKDGHYANNYQYSEIRAWLNEDFYNSAFALGNSAIQTTIIDNRAFTTNSPSNIYACTDTEDKVFLPSYKDYININYGFSGLTSSTDTRYCRTTDWARARGAAYSKDLYNGEYWTRSPYSEYSYWAWFVKMDGNLHVNNFVNFANVSVRPGLSIKIA